MQIFDDIVLLWDGSEYHIPSHRVLGAIARIEEVLTLGELFECQKNRGTVPVAKIAQAYGSALRYAGASATDDQVYARMYSGDAGVIATTVRNLITMMVPPDSKEKAKEAVGKLPGLPANKRSSSRRHTKQSSELPSS